MARLYVCLVEAGFSADYLDRCTLLDIDLLTRATNKVHQERASKR